MYRTLPLGNRPAAHPSGPAHHTGIGRFGYPYNLRITKMHDIVNPHLWEYELHLFHIQPKTSQSDSMREKRPDPN